MKKLHSFLICCLDRYGGSHSHCCCFTPREEPPLYYRLQIKCLYGGKKCTLPLSRIKP